MVNARVIMIFDQNPVNLEWKGNLKYTFLEGKSSFFILNFIYFHFVRKAERHRKTDWEVGFNGIQNNYLHSEFMVDRK